MRNKTKTGDSIFKTYFQSKPVTELNLFTLVSEMRSEAKPLEQG